MARKNPKSPMMNPLPGLIPPPRVPSNLVRVAVLDPQPDPATQMRFPDLEPQAAPGVDDKD